MANADLRKEIKGAVMTNKEYRQHDGISKSSLMELTKSPMHFKYKLDHPEEYDTTALAFGRALHKYVLEKEDFDKEFIVAPAIDGRTKAGKELMAELQLKAKEKNLEIISSTDFEKIKAMSQAIDENKMARKLLNGVAETSFFWTDRETGEMCKCRPDIINKIGNTYVCVDLKTCENADLYHFTRNSHDFGYDVQAAMYTEGLKINTDIDFLFMFVAIEKKPPYAINILQADEYFLKEGNMVFHELLKLYHRCKVEDKYPAYMGFDDEVANLSVPQWLLKEME